MNGTTRIWHRVLTQLAVAALAGAAGAPAVAAEAGLKQALAQCAEMRIENLDGQTRACTEHDGCRLMLNSFKTCEDAGHFLGQLRTAIGEGSPGLFGRRKVVTPDAVFEARITARVRDMDSWPGVGQRSAAIRNQIKAGSSTLLLGNVGEGFSWAYYGDTKNGKPEGVGTKLHSDGTAYRGGFRAGNWHGSGEVITPNGFRVIAQFQNNKRTGPGAFSDGAGSTFAGEYADELMAQGKFTTASGTVFEGKFKDNLGHQGKMTRADGVVDEGIFDRSELSVGKRIKKDGTVIEFDVPRERELAAAAKRDAAERERRAAEEERLAAERRKAEEQALAAQAYRDKLDTMNAGQLFALSDELLAQNDADRSKEVLRVLISRFPDHPLAGNAAEQLAKAQREENERAVQLAARREAEEQSRRRLAEQQAQERVRAAAQAAQQQRLEAERVLAENARREEEAAEERAENTRSVLGALTAVLGVVVDAKLERNNQRAAAAARLAGNQEQQRRTVQAQATQTATDVGSLAGGLSSLLASSTNNGSATGGAVGQNRGKGGNPDFMYDDTNHSNCVSVQLVNGNTGSKLAYGRYNQVNRCAYPIKLLMCVTVDNADGKPSPNYDNHQDGLKCPGMGWGGTTLNANETKESKTWFEYRNIKWQARACREGWDFIGEDGRFPSDTLGAKFSCRKWRP